MQRVFLFVTLVAIVASFEPIRNEEFLNTITELKYRKPRNEQRRQASVTEKREGNSQSTHEIFFFFDGNVDITSGQLVSVTESGFYSFVLTGTKPAYPGNRLNSVQ